MKAGRQALTKERELLQGNSHRTLLCESAGMALKMVSIYIFLSVMLGMTAALHQDMRGKMFTFSKETNTSFVKLHVAREDMVNATICLRIFSDLTRAFSLFSLTTPSSVDEMLIYKKAQTKSTFLVKVGDGVAAFRGLNYNLNQWQSVCATWEAESGLVQLWINGKASSRKFTTKSNLEGNFTVVLGQDQKPAEGGLHRTRSFVGMMRDVHMWDYAASEDDMRSYSSGYVSFDYGNVISWTSLEFDIVGSVLVEDKQQLYL